MISETTKNAVIRAVMVYILRDNRAARATKTSMISYEVHLDPKLAEELDRIGDVCSAADVSLKQNKLVAIAIQIGLENLSSRLSGREFDEFCSAMGGCVAAIVGDDVDPNAELAGACNRIMAAEAQNSEGK